MKHSGDELAEDVDVIILQELSFLKESLGNRPVKTNFLPAVIADHTSVRPSGLSSDAVTERRLVNVMQEQQRFKRTNTIWSGAKPAEVKIKTYGQILKPAEPEWDEFAKKNATRQENIKELVANVTNSVFDKSPTANNKEMSEFCNVLHSVMQLMNSNDHLKFYIDATEVINSFK